mmetsp:Transcript_6260/g.9093  ORF Transcript_6260/g.9093 Transcript_6260/m.9093 type:complete len:215 (+) Transcript_6260:309-953(+)
MKDSSQDDIPWAWVKYVRNMILDHNGRCPSSMPVKILDWLYLSNLGNVMDAERIKREIGITHVVTTNAMSSDCKKQLKTNVQNAGINNHLFVPGEDEEGYDMIGNHWGKCHSFLKDAKESGGRVVVHCVAGINRSALVVCAACMILEQIPVIDAVRYCIDKRGTILTNESFQKQLCILAKQNGLLGDYPESYSDSPVKCIKVYRKPSSALRRLF